MNKKKKQLAYFNSTYSIQDVVVVLIFRHSPWPVHDLCQPRQESRELSWEAGGAEGRFCVQDGDVGVLRMEMCAQDGDVGVCRMEMWVFRSRAALGSEVSWCTHGNSSDTRGVSMNH